MYFLLAILNLFSMRGETSYPYLSGYTWALSCDWRLINPDYGNRIRERFPPQAVHTGDTIFVDYDCLELFAKEYLPHIRYPIILITANYGFSADNSLPGPFAYLLESEKIAAWFTQNLDHPCSDKLIPIPIGLASKHWQFNNTQLMDQWVPVIQRNTERSTFLYCNIAFTPKRADCIAHFQSLGIHVHERRPFEQYIEDLTDSVFVVSPPGNGLDCHRTWEALLLGCYPIVQSSTLDPLFQNLPVLIVKEWSEVTPELLERKYQEFHSRSWPRDPLYAPYWFKKIAALRTRLQNSLLQ